MDKYTYTRCLDDRSIRILSLSPGPPGDVLEVRLQPVNIDRPNGEYDAISYVWGDPSRTCRIICNNAEMLITASLHGALTRLRQLDKPRRLWADQLCIDQDNLEEKAVQIPMMDIIYRNANHILVWLGKETSGIAEDARGLIDGLAGTLGVEAGQKHSETPHLSNPLQHLSTSKEAWSPLRALSRLPWVSLTFRPVILWSR